MVVLTNDTAQTVAPNAAVLFASNTIVPKRCSCITHNEGSGNIEINCAGIYEITFNANVTNPSADAVVTFGINVNGETTVGSTIIQTISTANSYEHISQTIRIKISSCCGCASRTVSINNISSGTTATVANALVSIDRVA